MRYLLFLMILFSFLQGEEKEQLGKMEVKTSDYILKDEFIEDLPMQKQFTIDEAMDIPGGNGDPLKAVQTLAGVVSTDGGSGDLIIHGSKPRETRVVIDNLPLGYAFHFGGLYSVISPEGTKQIDAYLGAFDVTYYGMGGVIDVIPNYPTGSGRTRLHIGMYDSDFATDLKLNDSTFLFLGARRSYFDLIANKIMDKLDEDEDDPSKSVTFTQFPKFYDMNMMMVKNYDNDMLTLEVVAAKDEMKIHTTMNKDKDPDAVGKLEFSSSFETIGTRWVHYGEGYTSNTLGYQLSSKTELEIFDGMFVDAKNIERGIHHKTVFSLDNHKPLIGFHYINASSPVKANIINRPEDDDSNFQVSGKDPVKIDDTYTAKTSTAFAQDIWSINEKWKMRYGIRAWDTNFQKFGGGVDPRGAIIYNYSDDTTLSFATGKYSQLTEPTFVIEGLGNPEIDTFESSNHYALSVKTKFKDRSTLIVEPYYKSFKNLAIKDSIKRYKAVGEGSAYGLDLTYKRKVAGKDLTVAYTYIDAKRHIDANDTTQYSFYGEIPHTLQVSSSTTYGSWKLGYLFKYSSGKLYTPVIGTTNGTTDDGTPYIIPINGEPFSERLPDIYDLDIKFSKTIKTGKHTSHEYAWELMNVTTLGRKNISEINYDDEWEKDGYVYQTTFIPAFHYTYRF